MAATIAGATAPMTAGAAVTIGLAIAAMRAWASTRAIATASRRLSKIRATANAMARHATTGTSRETGATTAATERATTTELITARASSRATTAPTVGRGRQPTAIVTVRPVRSGRGSPVATT